jgi:carboxymethylenebutenolidase
MKERIIEITTTDGRMETFVTHPERRGPFPAVVVYMDVWGIREELYDIARRIAVSGYYAVVPDLYYRLGRVRSEYRAANGKMLSLHVLPKPDQDKVVAPLTSLSDTMVVADTGALIAYLAAAAEAGEPVNPGVMGSIGYCMGGRHIMSVAAAYPDHLKASVGLHPTSLISERADSPHKAAAQLRGELYFGFAEHDPYAPLPMIEELAALLRSFPVVYRYCIHKGAKHGYALPDRDIYDKQAANRDWEIIFDMYRRQIPPT